MASWTKTITLTSGGEVTIQIGPHPFDLPADDREFVTLLVDKLKEYEEDAEKVARGEEP